MSTTAAEARHSTFEVFLEVALDGAPGDVGVGGDRVVAQAVVITMVASAAGAGLAFVLDLGSYASGRRVRYARANT